MPSVSGSCRDTVLSVTDNASEADNAGLHVLRQCVRNDLKDWRFGVVKSFDIANRVNPVGQLSGQLATLLFQIHHEKTRSSPGSFQSIVGHF